MHITRESSLFPFNELRIVFNRSQIDKLKELLNKIDTNPRKPKDHYAETK